MNLYESIVESLLMMHISHRMSINNQQVSKLLLKTKKNMIVVFYTYRV
jgi:hypothetical protein